MVYSLGEVTLRSRLSRVLTVLVIAIGVATEAALIARGDVTLALRASAPVALVAFGMYAAFWAPRITITPATIVVVNPFRTFEVSWPAVADIETRWALTIVTAQATITVWASPSPGMLGAASQLRRDGYGRIVYSRPASSRRPSQRDVPGTVARLAPMLLQRQWEEYRDAGLLGGVEGEGVTTRWHWFTILAMSALLALTVLGAVTQ